MWVMLEVGGKGGDKLGSKVSRFGGPLVVTRFSNWQFLEGKDLQ